MWGFLAALLGEVLDFLGPYFAGYQKHKAESAEENVKALFDENKRLASRPRTLSERIERLRKWKDYAKANEDDRNK